MRWVLLALTVTFAGWEGRSFDDLFEGYPGAQTSSSGADRRATSLAADCFDFSQKPRKFTRIKE